MSAHLPEGGSRQLWDRIKVGEGGAPTGQGPHHIFKLYCWRLAEKFLGDILSVCTKQVTHEHRKRLGAGKKEALPPQKPMS